MKRLLSLALCIVLFHCVLAADALALASNAPPPPSRQAAKVAETVAQLGAGEYSLVALRLQNKTVLKGQLSAIDRETFTLVDTETGAEHAVPYRFVSRLQGMNLVTGKQVSVGGGFRAKLARVAGFLLPVRPVMANSLTNTEKTVILAALVGLLLGIILAKAL